MVLLIFLCSPTACTWEGVRANINQTWALNNPHFSPAITFFYFTELTLNTERGHINFDTPSCFNIAEEIQLLIPLRKHNGWNICDFTIPPYVFLFRLLRHKCLSVALRPGYFPDRHAYLRSVYPTCHTLQHHSPLHEHR